MRRSVIDRYSVRAIASVVVVRVQVRTAGVTDEQRVTGQHEPRVITAGPVRHDIRVVRQRMTRRRDRANLRVPELDHLAVVQLMMLELDTRAARHIGGGAGALDDGGQSGDVVGLDVRLEDRNDRDALALGEGDVLVNQVDVRVDDGELALALAAEQV
jgi:hypothetical protein